MIISQLELGLPVVNPETPISDGDRISRYSINIISSRQVMGKEKKMSDSSNQHRRNCMTDIKENYLLKEILGVKGLTLTDQSLYFEKR